MMTNMLGFFCAAAGATVYRGSGRPAQLHPVRQCEKLDLLIAAHRSVGNLAGRDHTTVNSAIQYGPAGLVGDTAEKARCKLWSGMGVAKKASFLGNSRGHFEEFVDEGIFQSPDGGQSWNALNASFPPTYLWSSVLTQAPSMQGPRAACSKARIEGRTGARPTQEVFHSLAMSRPHEPRSCRGA